MLLCADWYEGLTHRSLQRYSHMLYLSCHRVATICLYDYSSKYQNYLTLEGKLMAQIITLKRNPHKNTKRQTRIVADYDMDNEFFRLWTYKKNDDTGIEGAKQIIVLDKEIAQKLRDELSVFLGE
jgi:hypothetical protein